MSRLFNMDNPVFRFLGRLADLMILNLIFIATCIPIVTIGAAWTALYYVTLKMVRDEESYIIRSYLKSFKENFKQATIMWLFILVFLVVMIMDFSIMNAMENGGPNVMRIGVVMVCFIFGMIMMYLFPLLSKFYNSIRHTLMNAFLMAVRHLPQTIIMLAVSAGAVVLTLINTMTLAYGFLIWIMMGFALVAFLNSWFLVRIFDKYLPEDPEEETTDTDETAIESDPL